MLEHFNCSCFILFEATFTLKKEREICMCILINCWKLFLFLFNHVLFFFILLFIVWACFCLFVFHILLKRGPKSFAKQVFEINHHTCIPVFTKMTSKAFSSCFSAFWLCYSNVSKYFLKSSLVIFSFPSFRNDAGKPQHSFFFMMTYMTG